MDLSIVIPLFNEDESLPELEAWIRRVMLENNFSYEIILVDDGSNDNSWQVIQQLNAENPHVKGIKFPFKTVLNLGMEIELVTSEVKINEGVTAEDFK